VTLHVERIPVVVKQGSSIAFWIIRAGFDYIQSINHAAIARLFGSSVVLKHGQGNESSKQEAADRVKARFAQYIAIPPDQDGDTPEGRAERAPSL
jgi:hypothetical protein